MFSLTKKFYEASLVSHSKTAVQCGGDIISYKDLSELVSRLSKVLSENGVSYKDNIGVLLPNDIYFVALILASASLGVSITPLNSTMNQAAVDKAFRLLDTKHIIGIAATLDAFEFPYITGLKMSFDKEIQGYQLFSDLISDTPSGPFYNDSVTGDEPLIMTMTSGSTGEPKPIILTQKNKFDRAKAATELYNVTTEDVILAATPLYHSLAERLVLMPLMIGATSVLMKTFSPAEWIKAVQKYKVSFTIAVSSQLRLIAEVLKSPFLPEIESLRCIVSSSALLEPHTKKELIAKLHCDFHECYGTSEIAIATNLDITNSEQKLKSVGKAVPGTDVKILKKDGSYAAFGETGEIICKTRMLFGGYFKKPEATNDAMHGEYFKTGDLGKLDSDGFLYYLGREKDLIISGAINIYPNDIDEVVSAFHGVTECAAFAYPDRNLGEIVAVALVVKDKENFNLKEMRFHCAANLADYQQPLKFFILDHLPKNNMGKLKRYKLSEELAPHGE
ncbi:MAG: acyl--CoA ligase [Deferribacteraceae bacterium]|jgi:acyl-CoA synthetase (AMP-forming)/AMP-acid ligase II|nr:acyl--CoA ligase [Deferribacteraceae bacterium]